MTSYWSECQGDRLEQGDYLPAFLIPVVAEDFSQDNPQNEISVEQRDLIVVTQSCDLANEKNRTAALCPIYPLTGWEELNESYKKKDRWESVRKGRVEGIHMLGAFENPDDNRNAMVVDFRQIFSLPVLYLRTHARIIGTRWRLQPPFREHFSQAFARFFMRVGLPAAIPPFK